MTLLKEEVEEGMCHSYLENVENSNGIDWRHFSLIQRDSIDPQSQSESNRSLSLFGLATNSIFLLNKNSSTHFYWQTPQQNNLHIINIIINIVILIRKHIFHSRR
jgi:hypothetical protein